MPPTWLVRRNDEDFGPFTPDEIRQRAASGWLREVDFIRSNKESPWIPASRVKDLKFKSASSKHIPVARPIASRPPREIDSPGTYIDEQGVVVSSAKYRVASAFGSTESDLNGYDSASLQENTPLFFGKPTYTVILHGWAVDKYSPSLTHSDRAFVERVVEALNRVIADRLAQDAMADSRKVHPSSRPSKPRPRDTPFKLIAPLLDSEAIQFIVLMYELNVTLPLEAEYWYEYSIGDASQSKAKGPSFYISELHDKLADAAIFAQGVGGELSLTSLGRQFAEWLMENGYQAEYFACPLGQWGERTDDPFWDL